MNKWKNVDSELPEEKGYYLVACAGGNVDKTFYIDNLDLFKATYGAKSSYSRKHLGKHSGYFDLAHKYGYKIMFWQEIPEPPDEVHTYLEDL